MNGKILFTKQGLNKDKIDAWLRDLQFLQAQLRVVFNFGPFNGPSLQISCLNTSSGKYKLPLKSSFSIHPQNG